MRTVTLFIAVSLDGYIADRNGEVEWLQGRIRNARSLPSTERIRFTSEPPCELVRRLREEDGKGIWICGGAGLAQQVMKEDLIDVWHISVIPTLLGGGIRLFEELEQERKLRLIKAQSCHGITELVYERR